MSEERDGTRRALVRFFLLALAYVVTGRLGLVLAIPPGYATAVWPASGIALAALLSWGAAFWPAIVLGSFLLNAWVSLTTANVDLGTGLLVAASIGVGSALQAVLGAVLLRPRVGSGRILESGPTVLGFAALSALCCLVAATWGVTTLTLSSAADLATFRESWRTWWLGDLTGVLLMTPVLLAWRRPQPIDPRPWQLTESLGSLAVLVSVTAFVFLDRSPQGGGAYLLSFLPLSCLVWIACRSGPQWVALATCLASTIAVAATSGGRGPFAENGTHESLLLLQAFTGLTTLTSLTLAAAVAAQKRSEAHLRELSADMEQLALTDELTGIRNRRGFLLLAEQGRRMADRTGSKCLLVYVDLDGLKQVNDTQGHAAGDALIIDAARILEGVFRGSDVIARVGGDEFAVLALVDFTDSAQAVRTRLEARIQEFNGEEGRSVRLSMSIGVEELSGAAEVSLGALISRADGAMYRRKREG